MNKTGQNNQKLATISKFQKTVRPPMPCVCIGYTVWTALEPNLKELVLEAEPLKYWEPGPEPKPLF